MADGPSIAPASAPGQRPGRETEPALRGSSYERTAPGRYEGLSAIGFVSILCLVGIVAWSARGAGFSLEKLSGGGAYLLDFLDRAWPPDLTRIEKLSQAMVETFQIALFGAFLGVILSLPIALLAARGLLAGRFVNGAVRMFVAFLRAVPDLVWALVFVIAVGLGPFAGTLAIMVDTIGFCGRFFADDMENVDKGPSEALTATGAKRIDVAACAVIPAASPALVSTSLYALEKAVRSSVILGLVGAGGIGIELKVAFDLFDYQTAMTLILMIAAVVILVEQLGVLARRRIIGDQR